MTPQLTKEQLLILAGLSFVILAGLAVMAYRHLSPADAAPLFGQETLPPEREKVPPSTLLVHVSGAVRREGVYRLKSDDRLIEALIQAGGALGFADLSAVNLAEKVKDGQKIVIPAKQAPEREGAEATAAGRAKPGKTIVRLNSAGERELCRVAGIGPSTAKRVVEYRSAHGPFAKLEDLMKVKGIGKGTFEKIKNELLL